MGNDSGAWKNILQWKNILRFIAVFVMVAYVGLMIYIVRAVNTNMNNINNVTYNLSQSTDITVTAVSAIEAAASNAISSTTLIITVAGVFMTLVSVFAAMIVFLTNSKLDDVDKKIADVDKKIAESNTRINVETYMRQVSSGIRYWAKEQYDYALKEFKQGLKIEDSACRLSANYYMGLLHIEMFTDNDNFDDFKEAEKYLLNAIEFTPDIDAIILNDSYASLGSLYGLVAQKVGEFHSNYLNKSEELLKKAVDDDTIALAVHYKNLAITYAFKDDVDNSIVYFDKAIQRNLKEKRIIDEVKQKKEIEKYINTRLFNDKEKQIIKKYKEIEKYLCIKYDVELR